MKSPPKPRSSQQTPSELRLPHPLGMWTASGTTTWMSRPAKVALALLSVPAVGMAFMINAVAGIGTLAVLGPLNALLWRATRSVVVRVSGSSILLPDATALPREQGEIVVEGEIVTGQKGEKFLRWAVRHSTRGLLYEGGADALAMRCFAEGLAFAGRWPLVWRPPGSDDEERREPAALDRSFVEREVVEPSLPAPLRRPPSAAYDVESLSDGVHRVRWAGGSLGRLGRLGGSAASAVAAMSVVGIGVGLSAGLGFGAALVLVVGAFALLPLTTPDVRLSPAGVEVTYRTAFGLPLWRRSIPVSDVESLYIDLQPTTRLILAGDHFFIPVTTASTVFEAEWLRSVIGRALLGEVPSPLDAPSGLQAASPSSPTDVPPEEGTCPGCGHAGLERVGGELDEERCPACSGRFLTAHGTERLVEGELGITRDMLRDLTGYFAGERRHCPSCRSRMSAVRLKGVTADLCQGCGGVWLDAGELAQLSRGRYDG